MGCLAVAFLNVDGQPFPLSFPFSVWLKSHFAVVWRVGDDGREAFSYPYSLRWVLLDFHFHAAFIHVQAFDFGQTLARSDFILPRPRGHPPNTAPEPTGSGACSFPREFSQFHIFSCRWLSFER